MDDLEKPPTRTTSSELLTLARRIERFSVMRRKYLAKVAELETNIRTLKSLHRQLAETLGRFEEPASMAEQGELP